MDNASMFREPFALTSGKKFHLWHVLLAWCNAANVFKNVYHKYFNLHEYFANSSFPEKIAWLSPVIAKLIKLTFNLMLIYLIVSINWADIFEYPPLSLGWTHWDSNVRVPRLRLLQELLSFALANQLNGYILVVSVTSDPWLSEWMTQKEIFRSRLHAGVLWIWSRSTGFGCCCVKLEINWPAWA